MPKDTLGAIFLQDFAVKELQNINYLYIFKNVFFENADIYLVTVCLHTADNLITLGV